MNKLVRWALLISLCRMPSFALGGDPAVDTPKSILDDKNPGHTIPIDPREADYAGRLERGIEKNQADQEKLKSGQMKREDYDKSVVEMKQKIAEAAAVNPESASVQTSAARAYIQVGDNAKAVERASQAMALVPNDSFPIMTRSLAYYKARDYPKATEDAKKALGVDPNNAAARTLYLLSKDRAAGGSLVDASVPRLRHIMNTVTLPPNPYLAEPVSRGSSLQGEARLDDDPELARYKTEKGRAYAREIISAEDAMRRKDYLTAYGLSNKAMTTYADNPRLLAVRAVSAFGLQNFRTAALDASLVLKAHPNMPSMLTTRAAAYNELGRHAEALEDAQKAVSLAPSGTDGRPFLERAIAREALHDTPANVFEDYKRAAELDPQFTADYESALARLRPDQASQAETAGPGKGLQPTARSQKLLAGLLNPPGGIQPVHLYACAALVFLVVACLALMRRS